jgi:hypothetical protein
MSEAMIGLRAQEHVTKLTGGGEPGVPAQQDGREPALSLPKGRPSFH